MQAAWLLSVDWQVVQSLQDNAWNLAIAQQLPQLLLCALRHLTASVAAAAAGALPDGAVARAYCLLPLQISRRQVGSRAEPGGAAARPSPQQQHQQHQRGGERGGERGGSERGAASASEAAAPHRVQLSVLVDQSTRNAASAIGQNCCCSVVFEFSYFLHTGFR